MNDRLKYEAAYLKGYIAVQRQLYRGDTKGAQEALDFLIDAHVRTLYDFSYFQYSFVVEDIDKVLYKAVSLR